MHIVVNTYGSKVLVTDGMLLIKNDNLRKTYPIHKIRSVALHKGVMLSSNAALLCIEHNVDILFYDKPTNPAGRIWSGKFGSISMIRKMQLEFVKTKSALEWVKANIAEKIRCSASILMVFGPERVEPDWLDEDMAALEASAKKIEELQGDNVAELAPTIRGIEGQASRRYFLLLGKIVPELFRFSKRSRRPADDMFNALLNYAYGILYARVEAALVRAGLDPYVGIFHRDEYNRPSMVYDVIETFRHWADYVVVHLVMQQPFNQDSFSIDQQGGYWVEGFARRMLAVAFQDYFDEVVIWQDQSRSRENHLLLYCQQLATKIKEHQ